MGATYTSENEPAPRLTKAVQSIIAINIAIYFLQLTVAGPDGMQERLGFVASDLSRHPWTMVTYMFVHAGFWHLALNMYMLFLFGPRVEHGWTTSDFSKFYVVSGLGGLLFNLLFSRDLALIGASAAVLGVTLAYATRWPDDEVFLFAVIPLKVRWLVVLLAGINLLGGMLESRGGGVAYLAHLGGLLTAWLYLRTGSTNKGALDRFRQRVSSVPDVPDETPRAVPRSLPRARERSAEIDDVVARSSAALASQPAAPPPVHREQPRMADINTVLDKISQHGIESLTSHERQLLEAASRELRRE